MSKTITGWLSDWIFSFLDKKNTKIEAPKFLTKSIFESLIQCALVWNVSLGKRAILPL